MTMEILSNFASIYCYISFVIGAVLMLVSLSIAAMGKDYEPRNKVRFFVTKDSDYYYHPILWIGLPRRGEHTWCRDKMSLPLAISDESFKDFGINIDDYKNLRWEDEPVEVFLNLED